MVFLSFRSYHHGFLGGAILGVMSFCFIQISIMKSASTEDTSSQDFQRDISVLEPSSRYRLSHITTTHSTSIFPPKKTHQSRHSSVYQLFSIIVPHHFSQTMAPITPNPQSPARTTTTTPFPNRIYKRSPTKITNMFQTQYPPLLHHRRRAQLLSTPPKKSNK